MSHFLWIEDFENNIPTTVGQVFDLSNCLGSDIPSVKRSLFDNGIILETTFMDALRFVRDPARLRSIDYVVIDVDLKPYEDHDLEKPEFEAEITTFLKQKGYLQEMESDSAQSDEQWKDAVNELKKVAGYHIYTELLIDAGFPKSHILFCSNHADQLSSIKEAFARAKLPSPDIYEKSHTFVREWTKKMRDTPYAVLRRGILTACKEISGILKRDGADAVNFNRFHKLEVKTEPSYLIDYLASLANQLPIREPVNESEKRNLYRVFVQALSREWDDRITFKNLNHEKTRSHEKRDQNIYLECFGSIMKLVRNWSAHGCMMETLDEADVSFIFMANLRAMFVLPVDSQTYELYLFSLFSRFNILKNESMIKEIGTSEKSRRVPLALAYQDAWRKNDRVNRSNPALYFDRIIADAYRNSDGSTLDDADMRWFIRALYRVFWLRPSKVKARPSMLQNNSAQIIITFNHCDFSNKQPKSFVFQFARHIYGKSFPEQSKAIGPGR